MRNKYQALFSRWDAPTEKANQCSPFLADPKIEHDFAREPRRFHCPMSENHLMLIFVIVSALHTNAGQFASRQMAHHAFMQKE
jgi:hypothetical protein